MSCLKLGKEKQTGLLSPKAVYLIILAHSEVSKNMIREGHDKYGAELWERYFLSSYSINYSVCIGILINFICFIFFCVEYFMHVEKSVYEIVLSEGKITQCVAFAFNKI